MNSQTVRATFDSTVANKETFVMANSGVWDVQHGLIFSIWWNLSCYALSTGGIERLCSCPWIVSASSCCWGHDNFALPGHSESIVADIFAVFLNQCHKVGILVSSLLLFFRYDSAAIQLSTRKMREGGEGEDGRMTPVEMSRETLEIQSHLHCSLKTWYFFFPCTCFALLDSSYMAKSSNEMVHLMCIITICYTRLLFPLYITGEKRLRWREKKITFYLIIQLLKEVE